MSGEHPHAQLVRDFHDHQNRFYAGGGQQSVGAMLTDDVVWHVPGESAIANEYRDRDNVLRHFMRRREISSATFRITVCGVIADDERAVILAAAQCSRGGELFQWRTVSIFRVDQGRIAECWVIPYDQTLFDRVWTHQRK
jgi:ketosteroid isomerase-like protein